MTSNIIIPNSLLLFNSLSSRGHLWVSSAIADSKPGYHLVTHDIDCKKLNLGAQSKNYITISPQP